MESSPPLPLLLPGGCSATLDYFSELKDAEVNNEANEELLRMILEENHP